MSIHQKIRQIRNYKDLSQLYMASKLKISQSKYNKLETGKSKICIDCFFEISKILSIPMDELYTQPLDTLLSTHLNKRNNDINYKSKTIEDHIESNNDLAYLLDIQLIILNRILSLHSNS